MLSICLQVVEDAASEDSSAAIRGTEEELLPCPICFKTCSSRLELDAHMDTHPDTALRYTHTHRSLRLPQSLRSTHKSLQGVPTIRSAKWLILFFIFSVIHTQY